MRRLFVGNFDFEHRLLDARRVLPERLRRLNAELASSWLAVADDGDCIWSPQLIAPEFWEQAAAAGLPRVTGVCGSLSAIMADGDLIVPWGWDAGLAAARPASNRTAVPLEAIRRINSRRWSVEREQSWNIGLPGAAACCSPEAVRQAIGQAARFSPRWVIKAEFGMSGRERIVGTGPPTEPAISWITRQLRSCGVVFFEPWVECLAEAGLSFEIPATGGPMLVGVSPMLSTSGGQYAGSRFWPAAESDPCWNPAIEAATRAAGAAQAEGYRGPLGIDAMLYRTAEGATGCRPLQDVNGRWTMGRLALGWRSRVDGHCEGVWWHGQRRDFEAGDPLRILGPEATLLRTSPESISGTPSHHVSALVVRPAPT